MTNFFYWCFIFMLNTAKIEAGKVSFCVIYVVDNVGFYHRTIFEFIYANYNNMIPIKLANLNRKCENRKQAGNHVRFDCLQTNSDFCFWAPIGWHFTLAHHAAQIVYQSNIVLNVWRLTKPTNKSKKKKKNGCRTSYSAAIVFDELSCHFIYDYNNFVVKIST